MQRYVARRLLLMFPTLLGLTLIIFVVLRLTPQDTVDLILGDSAGYQDPVLKAKLRKEFGLDSSIPKQYLSWLGDMATGDLGESLFNGRPVAEEMRSRVPVSVELGALALSFSIIVGVPIGVISAVYQDRWLDYGARGTAVLLLAIPNFWLALIVLVVGSRYFQWAPPARYYAPWENIASNLYIMLTPLVILGLGLAGTKMRLVRTQMLEILRQDYIRTARAKGLSELSVLLRHAAKNALIPVVTIIGLQLTVLVAGTVILERIFVIPGIGQYFLDAAQRRDFPIVQSLTLIIGVVIVVSNLLVDLSYAYLDPRVKYS